jgi:hypothetical protein
VFKKSCTQFGLNQGHENIFPYWKCKHEYSSERRFCIRHPIF